jgi:hypothetical protein
MTRRRDPAIEALKERFLKQYRDSGLAPVVEEVLGNIVARLAYRYSLGEAYQIVGIEPGDPPELAYDVWRIKARFFHPDNQKTGNREAFERLAAAYARIQSEG